MKCFIGFGKSSKFTIYILIIFICQLLCDSLVGFNNNKNKLIRIFNFTPNLKSHYLIKELISYLSAFICGIILYFLKNKIEMKKEGEISIRKHQKFKKKFFKEKDIPVNLILFFIFFLHSLNSIIRSFLYANIYYGDFWILEILFIIIISKIVFKIKISNHLKVATFLISGLLFIFRVINCFLPRTQHTCNSNKECKDKYLSDNNLFLVINKKFGSYIYVPILFMLFILVAIMRGYSWVKIKYLIDIKTIPLFKILLTLGIIGSTFIIISITILTYNPCNTLSNIK